MTLVSAIDPRHAQRRVSDRWPTQNVHVKNIYPSTEHSTIKRRTILSVRSPPRTSLPKPQVEIVPCEALVVGSGVAANAAALRLASQGFSVTIVSASNTVQDSATYWAQGGIIYKGKDDSPALLANDIHIAGAGICDPKAVEKVSTEGAERVQELLIDISNVPFERNENGELALTLEASHSRARIVHKADHTGKAIAESMMQAVQNHSNILLLRCRRAFELAIDEVSGHCKGMFVLTKANKLEFFRSDFTLLATGGLGDLYKNTSNPEGARGEGIGLASRAGAKLKNMQYVQFHPTTLYYPEDKRNFLLTEALRGEGAILLDQNGRSFAKDYDSRGELAPRDVVTRSILSEMEKQGQACMFLDISHKDASWIKARFPTIYQHCLQRGIDMTKQPLPVLPAAHYHCGGIEVDLHGQSSIPGLYAAGEVSCTGMHGANRLASTSLLEGLVWGCAAADDYLKRKRLMKASEPRVCNALRSRSHSASEKEYDVLSHPIVLLNRKRFRLKEASSLQVEKLLRRIQLIMCENVGPKRTRSGMNQAMETLLQLEQHIERLYHDHKLTSHTVGLRNALRAAKEVTKAAIEAKESIGTHFVMEENALN